MFLYLRTRTAAEGNNQNLYLLICLKIEYLVKLGGFPKPHINIVYLPEHSLYSKIWRVFNFWAFRRFYHRHEFSSVQSFSRVRLFATPWTAACQASLSITNSRSSLKLMSIKLVMPSSHLILCHPLLHLPPISPSIRVFSNESTLRMRWPKSWNFNFSIISSKEHPGLISFRMDWLDLLAIQGTLKSLLQHPSSKASILQRSHIQAQLSKCHFPRLTNLMEFFTFKIMKHVTFMWNFCMEATE